MKRNALLAVGITCCALTASAVAASASTPSSSGTVSPPPAGQTATYTWTGSIPGGANANSDCSASVSDSLNDHHTATFSIPKNFYNKHTLLATFTITPSAPAVDDVILTLESGATIQSADNNGNGAGETLALVNPGPSTVDAVTCAFSGGPQSYAGKLTLQTDPPGAIPGGNAKNVTAPGYTNYAAPSGLGDDAGEPSIGVDWKTNGANGGTAMYQAGLQTLRVVFDATGAATWTDVSAPNTSITSLDPILDADAVNGRTFVSQLTGQDSLFAFSDNDGGSWTPGQGGGIPSGVDHQSVGNGPYPAGSSAHPLTAYPNAVYYCSQDLATAFCARSDDGGLTFGAGVPIYTNQCGGLHGHVRVAPDGTVYVPNKSCGSRQSVVVSTDAGQSWTVRTGPQSSPGDSDPSVGVAADNSIYYGFVNGDGKPEIARSTDRGATFSTPVNVGAVLGIQNAVFPEVIAGSGARAAFAFLGTTTAGDFNNPSFGMSPGGTTYTGGTWHLYVSTTDDGGATWKTVDATPKDPVQRGAICTTGTTCGSNRNLLDFNDITIDKFGNALVAYADGCTGPCVTSTNVADNPHTAKATIARQVSGTLLFG
jgi:hypothetical protein